MAKLQAKSDSSSAGRIKPQSGLIFNPPPVCLKFAQTLDFHLFALREFSKQK